MPSLPNKSLLLTRGVESYLNKVLQLICELVRVAFKLPEGVHHHCEEQAIGQLHSMQMGGFTLEVTAARGISHWCIA